MPDAETDEDTADEPSQKHEQQRHCRSIEALQPELSAGKGGEQRYRTLDLPDLTGASESLKALDHIRISEAESFHDFFLDAERQVRVAQLFLHVLDTRIPPPERGAAIVVAVFAVEFVIAVDTTVCQLTLLPLADRPSVSDSPARSSTSFQSRSGSRSASAELRRSTA